MGKAMATDEFLYAVRNTGAKTITPLPKGRKAHRIERKQGTIKATARVLKQIFPICVPMSFVPNLVQLLSPKLIATYKDLVSRESPLYSYLSGYKHTASTGSALLHLEICASCYARLGATLHF